MSIYSDNVRKQNDAISRMFLALSDPTRLSIVRLIRFDEMSVGELVAELNESQPKVSRHLAFLRNCEIVETRRDGKHVFYHLDFRNDTRSSRLRQSIVEQIALISPAMRPQTGKYPMDGDVSDENIYEKPYVSGRISNDIEVFLL